MGDKDIILPEKVNALMFDQYHSEYFSIGEKVGQAWNAGAGLMKKYMLFRPLSEMLLRAVASIVNGAKSVFICVKSHFHSVSDELKLS